MGKPQYVPPLPWFPYKIRHRLQMMSVPKRFVIDTGLMAPAVTSDGVRKTALKGVVSERVADVSWPYTRKIVQTKKDYKHVFSKDRLERLDKIIESANATTYAKLANAVLDIKKAGSHLESKKKRGWTEVDWKKHMDYIIPLAAPKPDFTPPVERLGKSKPLAQLLPRIKELAQAPEMKMYRRISEEDWYRDPIRVSPNALKYIISERVKKLSAPRKLAQQESPIAIS